MHRAAITIALLLVVSCLSGQETEKKTYTAKRINTPPEINGIIDEAEWYKGEWQTGLIQFRPYNLRSPSEKTSFKILYDDNNLYVAIKAFDSAPDSIVRRITRRDDMDGDFVAISLDTYHDLQTAFCFFVTAGGSKRDVLWTNGGNAEDLTWDPIWQTKTSINGEGWEAEIRIPFSQLRFKKNSAEVWGFTVLRYIYRLNETDNLSSIPADAPGVVHLFDELEGLQDIKTRKQFDIVPYTVAQTERYEAVEGNPFKTGRGNSLDAGLDAKIGVTNNMILDLTVNPDFGQVEADPSQVNLTDFEIFYEEKRPFFVEGNNITDFNLGMDGGSTSNDMLFYSRRIGRNPQIRPVTVDGENIDRPKSTRILGAAKLSGKSENGLSIGFLNAVTAKEEAEITDNDETRFVEVEPLTNYFVGRLSKDYNKGNTVIGGMFTSVNRDIQGDLCANNLHSAAYSGGFDFKQYFADRNYLLSANTFFSQVNGSEEALLKTQMSSNRYFQRPDASHLHLDSSLTKLSGNGGNIQFQKIGNGHFNYMMSFLWSSPGLEVNDIGYQRSTDRLFQVFYATYSIWEPFSVFSSINFYVNEWYATDFNAAYRFFGLSGGTNIRFKNQWGFHSNINWNMEQNSAIFLRGGPSFRVPGDIRLSARMNTDNRRKVVLRAGLSFSKGNNQYSSSVNPSFTFTYKPHSSLSLSISPAFVKSFTALQYMEKTVFEGEERYIFGSLDQEVLMSTFRINYCITPELTVQYWGRPYLTSGKYKDLKRITDGQADAYSDRFHDFTSNEISLDDNVYSIDEDSDGITDYSAANPDFTMRDFQSNLVLRWEYLPGSTLYLVWSQNKSALNNTGVLNPGNDISELFSTTGHNIFLLKLSYRFGL